ncbi:MAG: hypothetical protein HC860_25640 [Alkalinema sp. RU_4_3]|nr:hypothetical protein [Alkalinema sp. RU_4_3]
MGKTVAHLTESMQALEARSRELGATLHQAYGDYLNAVGHALGQQMIMASYYVCTESYPDRFLKLGNHQRQILQDTLRAAGKQITPDLLAVLRDPASPDALKEPESDRPFPPQIQAEEAASLEEELKALLSMDTLLDLPQAMKPAPKNDVERLGLWQQNLERDIQRVIRQVSQQTNQVLQKFDILPQQIPAPVLEAAAMAEGGESNRNPHVVKLTLEAVDPRDVLADLEEREEKEEKEPKRRRKRDRPKPSAVLSIVAVQLRLSELEFKDSTVMGHRNRLRESLEKMRSIGQEYQRLDQECTIVKAQDAWRATWFNE